MGFSKNSFLDPNNQDGGHLKKPSSRHISTKNNQILMTFVGPRSNIFGT